MDMQKKLTFLESTPTKHVNNAPAKNMIFFTFFPYRATLPASEIFEPVAPRLLPKPRLTRCDSISRVHDSKGQILKPTPSAPQGESTDQKEHFSSMAEPNILQKNEFVVIMLCYVTNIPEVRNQAALSVTSFTVVLLFLQVLFVDVFNFINIYQQQTDSKT